LPTVELDAKKALAMHRIAPVHPAQLSVLGGHMPAFAEMMANRTGSRDLQPWLGAVEADASQPELRSFASGSATTCKPSSTVLPCLTAPARSRAP
jgi:hypothetical protein